MDIQINIDEFEGPLDLLLQLIQKNKIDIYDIPIFKITKQYNDHIKKWQDMNMHVASEYIVMAARLLEMKSAMLVPTLQETEESAEDLREKLLAQLLEYQLFKKVSDYFRPLEKRAQNVFFKDPEDISIDSEETLNTIDLDVLIGCYRRLEAQNEEEDVPLEAEIVREEFLVEEKMKVIYEALQGQDQMSFQTLLHQGISRKEVMVTFLALLELFKTHQITLYQAHLFGDIMIIQN